MSHSKFLFTNIEILDGLRHAFTRAIDSYATLFLKVWKIYVQA